MPKKQHSPEELKKLREQHLKDFKESLKKRLLADIEADIDAAIEAQNKKDQSTTD